MALKRSAGVFGRGWFRNVTPSGRGDVRESCANDIGGSGVISSTILLLSSSLGLLPVRLSIPGVITLPSGGLSKCGAGVFPLRAASPVVRDVCIAALSSIVPRPGVPWVSPPGAVLARPRVVALGGGFFFPPAD